MSSQRTTLVLAVLASLAIGATLPAIVGAMRERGAAPPAAAEPPAAASANEIRLTQQQIDDARIETAPVASGVISRRLTAPATVKPDPDHLARVAAKVAGSVAELRKRLGSAVERGEVVAIIDSREVADAKSEYLAAAVNFDLQTKLYERERGLFAKKITAEQLFLKAKTTYAEAKLRLDLARQKLASLDVAQAEIAGLATQPIARLREKEIRAPIAGRVIERLVNIGQPVTPESQIYVISDLSVLEADLSIPVASLAAMRDGQPVRLVTVDGRKYEGKVSIINAVVTPETRTGHVVAVFPNPDFSLHPGLVLNAEIELAQAPVNVVAPRGAVQTVHNEPVVFVRVPTGFEKRVVELGDSDAATVEIVKGLAPGEIIAVTNTFVLKAEHGKSEIPEE